MKQHERIARMLARKKALDRFKHWHTNEINRYVDTHYCDYLRFAATALAHNNRNLAPAVAENPLATLICRSLKAVMHFLRQFFS